MDNKTKSYREKILGNVTQNISPKGKILDVGCGDCLEDLLLKKWGLDVYGVDVYRHENVKKILGSKFKIGSILSLPYKNGTFDYVYAHDVLHHVDEENQSWDKHVQALKELKRVCKKNGKVIIIEANRYNFLFFPHMVLMGKHNHFTQSYFKKLCNKVFVNPTFNFFETHVYPMKLKPAFLIYERLMESVPFLRPFVAYNMIVYEK